MELHWNFLFSSSNAIVALIAVSLGILFYKNKRPRNYPPGHHGLPLVGYAPFLGSRNPGEVFMGMKKKYGPIMSVQVGRVDWIVLNDYDTIQEAFVRQLDAFSGRPSNFLFDIISMKGNGMLFRDYGDTWRELRKFGLTTLRGFGVGKKGMEKNITEETTFLLENLTSNHSDSLRHKITLATSNIISRILFGSRFEYDDRKFSTVTTILNQYFSDSKEARFRGLIMLFPILRFFPVVRDVMQLTMNDMERYIAVLKDWLKEHEETYIENDIRDVTDAFLKQMKKEEENSTYHHLNLLHLIRDLYDAGTITTSSGLLWMMLALVKFPDIQEKIYSEVVEIVGINRLPEMEHLYSMPYTNAFIHEIMRLKTGVPVGVMHKTNKKAVLGGYDIPKNATVVANLWAVHHDPDWFKDPHVLRPERFLDSEGNFVQPDHVIPFSVGPRQCLGRQLAKMEIFIFLTGIVQKLEILPDPDKPLPSFEDGAFTGLTYENIDYEVKFEER